MLFARKKSRNSGTNKITLPSPILNPVFGKVSYHIVEPDLEVMFTILMPRIGEGWQTGVALDASSSMKTLYGKMLTGDIPQAVRKEYIKRGWMRKEARDGDRLLVFESEAYEDAISKGYLKWTENIVEPEARKFIQYLAERLDADGNTTVIYWACGNGNEIEVLGDIQSTDCPTLNVKEPEETSYGTATYLLPALKYFVERFADASNGMYVFITDGRLEDLPAVKFYCVELAKRIEAGQRKPLKCVLIGLGSQIDQKQMLELDDLDSGTGVDIWDHKIATDMREVTEIFAELVDESMIVTPIASVYDDKGNLVKRFTDGLPARVKFRMPKTSTFFELEVSGQNRIRQPIAITSEK